MKILLVLVSETASSITYLLFLLRMSFHEQKFLIFCSQIHLFFFFFFAIAFVFWKFYYLPSSHPSPTLRLQGYSVFYSVYFIVLLLTFGSLVHLESEVIYEVRQESSFDISSHNNLPSSFPMLFIKRLSFSVNLSISLSHLSIYYLSLSDTNFSCIA